MTTALKTKIEATADALTLNPTAANMAVHASGELGTDFAVKLRVGGHEVAVDMPEDLGGGGTAPTPGELALASLGACQAITYRIWSEKLGVQIDALRVEVRGNIDVRPLVGASDVGRPGFGDVEVDVTISGPDAPERYDELRRAVDAHCPILDVFGAAVPTRTALEAS